MQIQDVSGYRLEQALELLEAQGIYQVSVKMTASPRLRNIPYDGDSRVVRYSFLHDGTLELLVCNMNS